ncbi:hypothetical protein TRFO_01952 [Tritrichomonas foetus]|uniref:Uncharacterized protein n=1 Tax=Tritrichomonas foetus TaxID=1144522 RepID=A0A1J4JGZ4_9EUKA|nr:hypothetical protein TRFO_01952 [Tritrichomonas foetus]|eukprot:OHS96875.1 hypothetical protein TRFO_01952 [Tritrichomonas foetus]
MPRKGKAKVDPSLSRRCSSEKDVVKNLIGNFDAKNSNGAKLIKEFFNDRPIEKISRKSLLALSQVIGPLIETKVPRNYQRSKELIIKWFDENEHSIRQRKCYISVKFNENESMNDFSKEI